LTGNRQAIDRLIELLFIIYIYAVSILNQLRNQQKYVHKVLHSVCVHLCGQVMSFFKGLVREVGFVSDMLNEVDIYTYNNNLPLKRIQLL
jgi:hypothetical protein